MFVNKPQPGASAARVATDRERAGVRGEPGPSSDLVRRTFLFSSSRRAVVGLAGDHRLNILIRLQPYRSEPRGSESRAASRGVQNHGQRTRAKRPDQFIDRINQASNAAAVDCRKRAPSRIGRLGNLLPDAYNQDIKIRPHSVSPRRCRLDRNLPRLIAHRSAVRSVVPNTNAIWRLGAGSRGARHPRSQRT